MSRTRDAVTHLSIRGGGPQAASNGTSGLALDLFRSINVFVAVVQNGSLSAAGRQMGMSPASVSRCVSALEQSLGVQLISRTSRTMTLTEPGKIYFEQAEQILRRLLEANDSVSQFDALPRGTLTVHSRTSVGLQFLIPIVPKFMRMYPDVKVVMYFSNDQLDLVERNIDIDIRLGRSRNSSMLIRKLAESERLLCAAPSYMEKAPPLNEPADLAHHNCLIYRPRPGPVRWTFEDASGNREDIQVEGSYETDFGPSLFTIAAAGMGIVLLPEWSVRDSLRDGRLVRLLANYKITHANSDNGVYAVYPPGRQNAAKVRAFLDFVSAAFKPGAGTARA